MRVEVIYALANDQDIAVLDLPGGSIARQALEASGLLSRHGLDAARLALGIGGKRVAPNQPLRDGDRLEILRALAAHPNEARRARAHIRRRILSRKPTRV